MRGGIATRLAPLVLLTLCGMHSASAVMITVNPNRYVEGTNLSNIQEGLTISRLTWPDGSPFGAPVLPTRSDVYATVCGAVYYSCLTPESVGFGMTYQLSDFSLCERGSGLCAFSQVNALEFLFQGPADSVSMLFTYAADQPVLYAYDINGTLIDSCNGFGGGCGLHFEHDPFEWGAVLTINRPERDIYRIVAGGLAGTSFAQSISYSVPEPSTIALMGIGLLGLLARRRRPNCCRLQPANHIQ